MVRLAEHSFGNGSASGDGVSEDRRAHATCELQKVVQGPRRVGGWDGWREKRVPATRSFALNSLRVAASSGDITPFPCDIGS